MAAEVLKGKCDLCGLGSVPVRTFKVGDGVVLLCGGCYEQIGKHYAEANDLMTTDEARDWASENMEPMMDESRD